MRSLHRILVTILLLSIILAHAKKRRYTQRNGRNGPNRNRVFMESQKVKFKEHKYLQKRLQKNANQEMRTFGRLTRMTKMLQGRPPAWIEDAMRSKRARLESADMVRKAIKAKAETEEEQVLAIETGVSMETDSTALPAPVSKKEATASASAKAATELVQALPDIVSVPSAAFLGLLASSMVIFAGLRVCSIGRVAGKEPLLATE
eukprot:gnl/TRDRNA2_/TRDRNA2_191729_c0_seq1.p1 gnl/TRDRNA2_/TRDRNA2_191729_c0~~gnl/TRDRNA2_/TRDRNA2_191729_c0_seq1.p1  ORF type:complete len:205 (+),score=24.16 gnl/TRDRNA2_/TRDRNA2_191729_c0_seq1:127-741(+)